MRITDYLMILLAGIMLFITITPFIIIFLGAPILAFSYYGFAYGVLPISLVIPFLLSVGFAKAYMKAPK